MRTGWFGNAYLLLILTTLFWAGNASAGKLAVDLVSPFALTFLRWVIACAILLVLARPHLRTDWPVLRERLPVLFALGAIGFTGFNLGIYGAVHYTSAINVTIEQGCMPALIMLINYAVFRQRISALQGLGLLITVVGVLVTATHGAPLQLFAGGLNRGDAIMLLAVLAYAGYTVALRDRPQVHWLSMLLVLAMAALLSSAPFFLWDVLRTGLPQPGAQGWLIIAYIAVFPSILSQLFFIRGVELIGPNRAGLFINLVPVFGAVLAVLVAGEVFRAYHAVGIGLVIGGIAVAERLGRVRTA